MLAGLLGAARAGLKVQGPARKRSLACAPKCLSSKTSGPESDSDYWATPYEMGYLDPKAAAKQIKERRRRIESREMAAAGPRNQEERLNVLERQLRKRALRKHAEQDLPAPIEYKALWAVEEAAGLLLYKKWAWLWEPKNARERIQKEQWTEMGQVPSQWTAEEVTKELARYLEFRPKGNEALKHVYGALVASFTSLGPTASAGKVDFGGIRIAVQSPLPPPRQQTAEWVMRLGKLIEDRLTDSNLGILELSCGTGAISVLLSAIVQRERVAVSAVDVDETAVLLSQYNGNRLWPHTREDGGPHFDHIDTFREENVTRCDFDMLVSNPSHVADGDIGRLDMSPRSWQELELFNGKKTDGLDFYRKIPGFCKFHDSAKEKFDLGMPRIVVEVGDGQADAVVEIFRGNGYPYCERWQDKSGRDRCILAYDEWNAARAEQYEQS